MVRFREISLAGARWASLAGDWQRRETDFVYDGTHAAQNSFNFLVCDTQLTDGALEASVRVSDCGDASARLVFRHGPNGCYYAGIGGYGRHFAIVKYVRSNSSVVSVGLALDGLREHTKYSVPYELRVEFTGDLITLKSRGVTVLEARDKWFSAGHIGLESFGQSYAEFSGVRAYEIAPIRHLLEVLESFPHTLKRDNAYFKRELQDEKDVQRILWTVLRSHYPDLIDEEVLGKFGLKHYQDDFGIPSLGTIIEVKMVRETTNLRALQDELMVDAVGYFETMNTYRHLVFFLYNQANRHIDQALIAALETLQPVAAVVIVPGVRP